MNSRPTLFDDVMQCHVINNRGSVGCAAPCFVIVLHMTSINMFLRKQNI